MGSFVFDLFTPDVLIDIRANRLPATLFLNLGYMNTRKLKKLKKERERLRQGEEKD